MWSGYAITIVASPPVHRRLLRPAPLTSAPCGTSMTSPIFSSYQAVWLPMLMLPSIGTLLPVEPRRARRCSRRLMSRSGEGRLLREEDRLSAGRPSRSLPPSSILQAARIASGTDDQTETGTAAAAPTPAAPAPRASTSEPRMCYHTRAAACVGAPPTQTQLLYPPAGRARYPASWQPDPRRERLAPCAPPDLFGVPMPDFFLPSVDGRDIERGFPPRGRAAAQKLTSARPRT